MTVRARRSARSLAVAVGEHPDDHIEGPEIADIGCVRVGPELTKTLADACVGVQLLSERLGQGPRWFTDESREDVLIADRYEVWALPGQQFRSSGVADVRNLVECLLEREQSGEGGVGGVAEMDIAIVMHGRDQHGEVIRQLEQRLDGPT